MRGAVSGLLGLDGEAAAALAARATGAARLPPEAAARHQRALWASAGRAALHQMVWLSQVRHRLWLRNGTGLLHLEAVCSSNMW